MERKIKKLQVVIGGSFPIAMLVNIPYTMGEGDHKYISKRMEVIISEFLGELMQRYKDDANLMDYLLHEEGMNL